MSVLTAGCRAGVNPAQDGAWPCPALRTPRCRSRDLPVSPSLLISPTTCTRRGPSRRVCTRPRAAAAHVHGPRPVPPTPLFALHTTLRPPSPADPRPHDLPAPHQREAGDNQPATRHRVPSGAVPEGCTCLPRLPPPGSTPRSLPRTVTTSGPVPLTLLAPPPPAADSVACGARPISLCVARARRYVWGRRHVCARVCAHVCGLHTRACSGSHPCSREAEDGWTQVGLEGGGRRPTVTQNSARLQPDPCPSV